MKMALFSLRTKPLHISIGTLMDFPTRASNSGIGLYLVQTVANVCDAHLSGLSVFFFSTVGHVEMEISQIVTNYDKTIIQLN